MIDSGLQDRLAVAALQRQLNEAQATITHLEATINKALDLDYKRRQEIAEAIVHITALKADLFYQSDSKHGPKAAFEYPSISEANAYLAAHEEKEND